MSKKIIFIGPPGAGKTTLRKVFFEGENSNKLLEYALEPTFGEESLIMRLPGISEEIGVFDLAGQENERWLNSDDKDVFYNTKVVILVMDASLSLDYIRDFIKKVLEVRDELIFSTIVYVLMHKIDLITPKKIEEIKAIIRSEFPKTDLTKFIFTSLKKRYFKQTFSYFIEIMKSCLEEEILDEGLIFNVIDESIKLIHLIHKEVIISLDSLYDKLNRPQKLVDYLIESLMRKDHIIIDEKTNKKLISLTDKGRSHFKAILESYSKEDFIQMEDYQIESMPSFLGVFIADKDGKLLAKFEIEKGTLEKYLLPKTLKSEIQAGFDLDLVPMFISALEKFSLELNIQELTKLGLEGTNLKLRVFGYEDYTVTLFLNPNINLESIEIKIKNFFENLFNEHQEKFKEASRTGNLDDLKLIEDIGRDWLRETNQLYEEMIINLTTFDNEHAKELYDRMDNLYEKIKQQFSITLERVKKLKVNLVRAILENDFDQLKLIATQANNLISKYAI